MSLLGSKCRRIPPREIESRVVSALAQVNLTGFESRRVTDLSGGEQQRVALARALAPEPLLLMFDEPLGALDRSLREHLISELRGILHRTRVPSIYVTHDQEEAFTIADKVLLLHEGRIVQSGPPNEVYSQPANGWVAEFLGLGNLLSGHVNHRGGGQFVHTEAGDFNLKCSHNHHDGDQVWILIRPAGASMGGDAGPESISGVVSDVLFHQSGFKTTLDNGLFFFLPIALKIGDQVRIHVGSVECLG